MKHDDFEAFKKHKYDLDQFDRYYFEERQKAYTDEDLDRKIESFKVITERSKQFEEFCKSVGLSKHINELYKQAYNSRGRRNLFKEDRDELKRLLLLKKVLKRVHRLSFNELQHVDVYLKSIKHPQPTGLNSDEDQKNVVVESQNQTAMTKLLKFFK